MVLRDACRRNLNTKEQIRRIPKSKKHTWAVSNSLSCSHANSDLAFYDSEKNSFLRKYFIHNFSTFFYDSSSTEKTFGRQKTILLTRREAPYRICCLHLWYRCTQERQTLGFIVAREIKRWKWRKKQRKVNLVQESSWFKE